MCLSQHLKLKAFSLKSVCLAALERSEDMATPDLHLIMATKAKVEQKLSS